METSGVKVSVVTSTFNRADIISRPINSVLDQTYQNWEMCIVGDCTPDDTGLRVASFGDKRLRFHNLTEKSPEGGHGALAKNYAIEHMARGKYIAYLDDDDEYKPRFLETMVGYLEAYPECDVVYCRGTYRNKETGRKIWGNPFQRWLHGYSREKLLRYNYITTNWVVHKKELLDRVGLWNPNTYFDDYELWLRISEVTDFHYINKVLVINYFEEDESFWKRAFVKSYKILKAGGKRMPLPYDGDYGAGSGR